MGSGARSPGANFQGSGNPEVQSRDRQRPEVALGFGARAAVPAAPASKGKMWKFCVECPAPTLRLGGAASAAQSLFLSLATYRVGQGLQAGPL